MAFHKEEWQFYRPPAAPKHSSLTSRPLLVYVCAGVCVWFRVYRFRTGLRGLPWIDSNKLIKPMICTVAR